MARLTILEPTELYSQGSRHTFSFDGWDQEAISWPKSRGENLGQTGAFNLFLRGGFKPEITSVGHLYRLRSDDVVVVDLPAGNAPLPNQLLSGLSECAATKVYTGSLSGATSSALGLPKFIERTPSSPYNSFGVRLDGFPTPIQPADWAIYAARETPALSRYGQIFEIAGDRLDPGKALCRPVDGASLIYCPNDGTPFVFLNGHVLSAFQAWLQGQEDLTQWLGWAPRQHWLEQFADGLLSEFSKAIDLSKFASLSVASAAVCFRHDNDDSCDGTFAQVQDEAGVEATYALLHDGNLDAWKAIRTKFPRHEYALHFTTIERRWRLNKYLHYALSKTPLRGVVDQYSYGRDVYGNGGLVDQVSVARNAGISVTTLHRHFAYLAYPEFIDALDGVYESFDDVRATSSLFRGNIYRWGANELDGTVSSSGAWPDVQFPFWLPWKLAHAGRQGKMLAGWECTLLMEPEPEFLAQVLATRYARLPQKFVMVCYHPANTVQSPFIDGGSIPWLKQGIDIARHEGYDFYRYDRYIAELNNALETGQ